MRGLLKSSSLKVLVLVIGLFAWYNRSHHYAFSFKDDPVLKIHKEILAAGQGEDLTEKFRNMSEPETSELLNLVLEMTPANIRNEYKCTTSSLFLGNLYIDPFSAEEIFNRMIPELKPLNDSGATLTPLGYTNLYFANTGYGPILLISFHGLEEKVGYFLCHLKR